MSNERILLEFNEKAFNELVENQANAKTALHSLVGYCEETLKIKIEDLKAFYQNPKQYCIDQYWKKYGLQYGDAPIQKEKAIEMTAWSDVAFEAHHKAAKVAFNFLAPHQYEIGKDEVSFNANEEDFKKYVREEDREVYNLTLEFIAIAEKMKAIGGTDPLNLVKYYPTIGVINNGKNGKVIPGNTIVPSRMYFTNSGRMRKDLSKFL